MTPSPGSEGYSLWQRQRVLACLPCASPVPSPLLPGLLMMVALSLIN